MANFVPIPGANYKHDYNKIFRSIAAGKIPKLQTYRELCKTDLFFLLYFGLNRRDVNDPFVIACIREVEEKNHDTLDLWAREHYKSTILTFGLPIQEVIKNPEERICFFSHTRPIAKGFLREIKHTLESDVPVKKWFPEIFYKNPKKQAPKWSEDDGLIVKRKTTPKEATFEAWGLVDGQPTSKHFSRRVYDDVVTEDSVTTPEQIRKTVKRYELSHSLGTSGGTKRVIGTHYHHADLYAQLRAKESYAVRIKPATDNGKPDGKPVFLSPERLQELRTEQGAHTFACQQLLNPIAEEEQKFKLSWLKFYDKLPRTRNKYLIVDPANKKRKQSDYTVMGVISIDSMNNRFLEDLMRDKLNLGERWLALRDMYHRNRPILSVGYEEYGMQADIAYMEERQGQEGYYFGITPLGGSIGQDDRIMRMVPVFQRGEFYLPHRLIYTEKQSGKERDLIKTFIDEEYSFYPFCGHQDMLDMISRMDDEALYKTPPTDDKDIKDEIAYGPTEHYPGYQSFFG